MFATIMGVINGLRSAAFIIEKLEKYVLMPIAAWWRNRKDKQIDAHYDKKAERIKRLSREVEDLRKQENTKEIDMKLRDSLRKMQNLGVEDDNNA